MFGSAPWRRAPLLLLRHPPVLAAVAGATLVLGSSAAVGPVFLSSAADAAVARQVASRCAFDAGLTVSAQATGVNAAVPGAAVPGSPATDDYALLDRRTAAVSQAARNLGHLQGPVLQLTAPLQAISLQTGPHGDVRLLYRQGALDHVKKLADAGGSGVWITNTFAGLLSLHPGDRFQLLASGGRALATVRVRGLYQDMEFLPKTAYWCADESLITPPSIFSETIPSPLIVVDQPTYRQISRAMGDSDTIASWAWTPDRRLTVEQASQVATGLPKFQRAIENPKGPFSTAVPFRSLLGGQEVVEVRSGLPFIAGRAKAIRGAVRAGTSPASSAGSLVSILLVAAAGSYWVDRRRNEVTMLAARGAGRAALGLKAALEMGPAAVVGVVVGAVAALLLVQVSGPSSVIAPSAIGSGAVRALVAGGVALAALGTVAAVRVAILTERPIGTRQSVLRRVPFELAAVAGAVLTYLRLRTVRPPVVAPATRVPPVDSVLLLFPLLFLVGLVGFELRLAVFGLGRLRRRRLAWAHGLFLAARRLGAAPAAAALLAGASALSIGVLVYSATLTGSVRATLAAKAKVFVGSDLAVTLRSDQPLPSVLSERATVVRRVLDATDGGQPVDLLGIDPATFTRGAFWDPSFARASLTDLVHRLSPASTGGAVPVLAANGSAPAGGTITVTVEAQTVRIPIVIVGQAGTFPGEHYGQPAFVAAWPALTQAGVVASQEAWVRGSPSTALAAFREAGIPATFAVDEASVLDKTDFLTASWTFGYLRALGILTGLMTIGGMLLYLESRQRARKVAYALARRMGLRRGAHAASIATELAATLGSGVIAGGVLASAAAWLTYGHIDSAPQNPPTPLLLLPWSTYAATALAAAAVVAAGACLTQRSADRARIAQELRVAE